MKFFIGVDDSGRGPVVGPMVLAGVLADEKQIARLKELRVRDSKLISPKRRAFLSSQIKKIIIAYHIVKISPREIDERGASGLNLNKIEAIKSADIIKNLVKRAKVKIVEAIIDCPSSNIAKWKAYLESHLEGVEIKLRCEHKADVNHIIVSAASILAKVTRDAELNKIKRRYKIECGSGYPSDPVCQEFLKKEAKKYENEGIFRKTWSTWGNAVRRREQKKIDDF